jgi:hypothetical protein
MTSISVIDHARADLQKLINSIENPAPGLIMAGRAVAKLLRKHYEQKHANEPNKLGGKRQNFWLRVKHGVNEPRQTAPDQVTVSVSDPAIMQKIKGGTISAKRATMLTIPVDPRAYGRAASVLEHELGIKLVLVAKSGRAFLAGRITKGKGSGLRVFYVLKKSVNQRPDPTALPPEEQITQTATDAFNAWIKRGGH